MSCALKGADSAAEVLACVAPFVTAAKYGKLQDVPIEEEAETLGETFGRKGIGSSLPLLRGIHRRYAI